MNARISRLDFPILGTQYWRAPTPEPSAWKKDLRAIGRLGFSTIQLRVQWSWHERNEGQYDFSEVQRLMDLAEQAGLRVVIKFMLEDAPYWLYDNYDAMRIGPDAQPIWPAATGAFYAGLSMPCFDRPLVRQKAEGFVRGLTRLTADHPAMAFYSLWNEIRSRPFEQCACPDSRRMFHQHLQQKFGTVEKMNRALGKDYGEFSHVRPPVGILDHTTTLLWRGWCRDTLMDTLAWMRSLVRDEAPRAIVVTHSGMCNMVNSALGDATHDQRSSAIVDMMGHSGLFWDGHFASYQEIAGKTTRDNAHWRDHQYVLSMQDIWIRHVASGKPAMNYEIYSNDYGGFQADFDQPEMEDFYLTSLSEGVSVLMVWQYRSERVGNEFDSSGLVGMDGPPTARSRAVGRICKFVNAHRALLAAYRPEAGRVAILYDHESDLMSALQDNAELRQVSSDQYAYKRNLKGWYRLFWDANIPADMIPADGEAALDRYDVVVLPSMMCVPQALRKKILAYAADGGKVIADCGFELRCASSMANPRPPGRWTRPLWGDVAVTRTLHRSAAPRVHDGDAVHNAMRCADSTHGLLPLGQYRHLLSAPNGPWHSRQGRNAILFSFNPGEARFMNPQADFSPFYRWLSAWSGLKPSHAGLRVRKGRAGRKTIWFVHNVTDSKIALPLAGAREIYREGKTIGPDQWGVLVRPGR